MTEPPNTEALDGEPGTSTAAGGSWGGSSLPPNTEALLATVRQAVLKTSRVLRVEPGELETNALAAIDAIASELEGLQRIAEAAREYLIACDENDDDITSMDAFCTLVEAVSGLPDTRDG